jgi:hypothetical protein
LSLAVFYLSSICFLPSTFCYFHSPQALRQRRTSCTRALKGWSPINLYHTP